MNTMHIVMMSMPVIIVLIFDTDEKYPTLFERGDYQNDYVVRIGGKFYHPVGIMVSQASLVVILSIIGILFTWMAFEAFPRLKREVTIDIMELKNK